MTRDAGVMLPGTVQQAFDGADLDSMVGLGYVVVTLDEDGCARPSMLSAGEILVTDPKTLRLALWSKTRTGRNLRDRGSFLLCFVGPGIVCYIRGNARPLDRPSRPNSEAFEVEVTSVENDHHPGLPTTGTITFECEGMERDALREEWSAQLSWLGGG